MLLLVDIGNSNTKFGMYDKGIRNVLTISTCKEGRGIDEYIFIVNGFIKQENSGFPEGAIVSSVAPEATGTLVSALKKSLHIESLVVHHQLKTGLRFMIQNVESLGSDRICNAAAANRMYRENIIIADFGTATTFDVLTRNGEFKGGTIMPGLGLSIKALAAGTSKLPEIDLKKPSHILGGNTINNIQSGIILGHAGAAEKIIGEISRESHCEYKVIVTGGYSVLMEPFIKGGELNSVLTLEGLRLIYELNT